MGYRMEDTLEEIRDAITHGFGFLGFSIIVSSIILGLLLGGRF